MKSSTRITVWMIALLLAGCGHSHHDSMKVPMGQIRGMVKQAAVLASQAACAAPDSRTTLMHAAAAMLRRGMGGPEMASIHKMMGQMTMDQPGKMPEQKAGMSAEEMMHVNIHSAGEDAFDFLDAISQTPALSCKDVQPVSLAATAGLLRESPSQEVNAAVKQLDEQADTLLKGKTPDAVRALALALKKI